MRVGIVGCGNICPIYLHNLRRYRRTSIAGVTDFDRHRSRARANEFGVEEIDSLEALVERSDVDLIVNLTTPASHYEVAQFALKHGKHVYNEKPLSLTYAESKALCDLAASQSLRLGCAPDTFLGAGLQACISAVCRGEIGAPVACETFMMCHGHESWHPAPAFYYQQGGGPLFDMGPYYLTALVAMLGPIVRVSSMASTSFTERLITSQPLSGEKIIVETPTHISASLQFGTGAIGTVIMSFDVWHHKLPNVEVHGSDGSMIVPDPNSFSGPAYLRRGGDSEWREMQVGNNFADNSRGVGVLDMAAAIADSRPHLASGELAAHIVEVMEACLESAKLCKSIEITSKPDVPDLNRLIERDERA